MRETRNGLKIGRILGIEISLNYSWFIIFTLITWGLSAVLFPQAAPGFSATTYLAMGVVTSLLFFGSVLFHELMHSVVARSYGLPIEGITLMIFGGVSQLADEPQSPAVEFKMAIAGPLSSLVIGAFFVVVFLVGQGANLSPVFLSPVLWLGYINIVLAIFNMLPGFPLDGGRVLRSAIWHFTGNLRRATAIASGFGKALSYGLISLGVFGVVSGNIGLLWFLLLGWILLQSAEAGYQQVVYRLALEGVTVGQAMTPNPRTISPELTLADAVTDYFTQHLWVAYPVVDDREVLGIVTFNSVKGVSKLAWDEKRVRDVMRPLSLDIVTQPEALLTEVLPKLNLKAEGRMLVMKGASLMGILTAADVTRVLMRQMRYEEAERRAG
ncbi:MAG: site-2 protease family protein [Actinobacteria bacterium]|nr:site-2 protease family protein [Actinomycetota bacterium]